MPRRISLPSLVAASLALWAAAAPAQDIVCSLELQVGEWRSSELRFGFREEAAGGLDDSDLPAPPPPPDVPCWVGFRLPDPISSALPFWLRDLRDPQQFADQVEIFILAVENHLDEQVCRLLFDQVTPLQPLHVRVLGLPDEPTLPVPAEVELLLPPGTHEVWIELSSETAIGAEERTWGTVKSLY